MGCSGSAEAAPPAQQPAAAPAAAPQPSPAPVASAAKGQGKGAKGKGKGGKGKGKGKGGPTFNQIMKGKWQITLGGDWKDYGAEEDGILKKAYLIGQPNAKFSLRGQDYEYHFKSMTQKNLSSGKERKIRPPMGMKPPAKPLVAQGGVIVIAVPQGQSSIEIDDPNNPGRKLTIAVPPGAKKGSKMVVPVPNKGESVEEVVQKQKNHSMSTGSKVAVGAAAVGALAIGGVVLGEHLSDGAVSEWAAGGDDGGALGAAADWTAGAAADVGDWTAGAAEDVGDWTAGAAEDVGDWTAGAAEDIGDWAPGAAEDVGDWTAGAAEDAVDWGADAAEDIGDFVMSLF